MRRRLVPALAVGAVALAAFTPSLASAATEPLVPFTATWSVLDNGTDQTPAALPAATNFASTSYVESSAWHAETVQAGKTLGYGDNGSAQYPTQTPNLSYGPSSGNKYITTYFRGTFDVADPSLVTALDLSYIVDDGLVIYVNGQEVHRYNLPTGAINYTTWAPTIVDGAAEYAVHPATIPASVLVAGENLITVEVHQRDGTSSDLRFTLALDAEVSDAPAPVVPEAPMTVLLSLGGVAVMGGAVLVLRRRNALA